MEKLCFVFILAMSAGQSRICNLKVPREKLNTTGYVHQCIARCLDLHKKSDSVCEYSETSGNVVGEKCEDKFYPEKRSNMILACSGWIPLNPLPNGLNIEPFVTRNKLSAQMCDYMFYAITKYNMEKAKLVFTELPDFHLRIFRDALQAGTKTVLSLGSYGDDNMSGRGFMSALSTEKSRAEFFNDIISLVMKFKFAGVAFHWIYPGCPQSDCKFKKDRDRVLGLANDVLRPLREMGLTTFYFYTINRDVSMFLDDYFSEIMPHVDYFMPELANQAGHSQPTIEFDNSLSVSMDALAKMAQRISNKKFLSKNLYHVMVRGKQYEAFDAKKATLKAMQGSKPASPEPSFGEYCQKLALNFTQVKKASEQNFAYSGKTVIVYDGIESLRAKADFAREKLAGMMVNELHADDIFNQCGCGHAPYLRMVAEALKGRDCILKPCY